MFCPKCGTQNDDNNFKCVKCGTIIQQISRVPIRIKETSTATILLWALGPFVVIAMIGIIAAIVIPAHIGVQNKARHAMAMAEIKNACSTATTLFIENPDRTISIEDLKEKGVGVSPDVELSVEDGKQDSLRISAKHNEGIKVFVADKDCHIQEMMIEARAK
jgi:Tfp pilus assembly protein PilE